MFQYYYMYNQPAIISLRKSRYFAEQQLGYKTDEDGRREEEWGGEGGNRKGWWEKGGQKRRAKRSGRCRTMSAKKYRKYWARKERRDGRGGGRGIEKVTSSVWLIWTSVADWKVIRRHGKRLWREVWLMDETGNDSERLHSGMKESDTPHTHFSQCVHVSVMTHVALLVLHRLCKLETHP